MAQKTIAVPTPREWVALQKKADIDDRTLAALVTGRAVSAKTLRSIRAAADYLRIELPEHLRGGST